jgi:GDP-L-fucose synthase
MLRAVLESFKGRHILVTGGTGLIGREVVSILVNAGAQVRIVSLDKVTVNAAAQHVYGDLSSFDFCKDVCKGMDAVFHLAGIKGSIEVIVKRPASVFVPILMMNTNVLEASRVNGVQRLLYTSTIGCYPSAEVFRESDYRIDSMPMEFSGWSKRMGELQIKAYKAQYGLTGYSAVRPANVYGPGDNFDPANAMVIPSLIRRVYGGENPLVVWGDGSAIRDFVYSRDAAEGCILALHHGTGEADFLNIGSGIGYSIRELVETLQKVTPFEFRFDPSKPSGFPKRVMDISLARTQIGFEPTTTLAEGLRRTAEWFVGHQDEYLSKKNYFTA